jgi:ABC-type branched-subunit amino acid transport system ATPase component
MVTNQFEHDLPVLALDAADIIAAAMQHDRRVFLFGPMGVGKSTLAAKLADAIIAADGDIDKLSHEIERDYSFAVFRRSLAAADLFYKTISLEYLKQYKLWAHSFDLNLREVLATEHNIHGPISNKAREQLRDMLAAGAEQVNAIVRVLV